MTPGSGTNGKGFKDGTGERESGSGWFGLLPTRISMADLTWPSLLEDLALFWGIDHAVGDWNQTLELLRFSEMGQTLGPNGPFF